MPSTPHRVSFRAKIIWFILLYFLLATALRFPRHDCFIYEILNLLLIRIVMFIFEIVSLFKTDILKKAFLTPMNNENNKTKYSKTIYYSVIKLERNVCSVLLKLRIVHIIIIYKTYIFYIKIWFYILYGHTILNNVLTWQCSKHKNKKW